MADALNHRIQVFTAEGKFSRAFGRHGQCRGELNRPLAVAIDAKDRVYVTERGNLRVSVFTSEGHCLTSFWVGLELGGVYVLWLYKSILI